MYIPSFRSKNLWSLISAYLKIKTKTGFAILVYFRVDTSCVGSMSISWNKSNHFYYLSNHMCENDSLCVWMTIDKTQSLLGPYSEITLGCNNNNKFFILPKITKGELNAFRYFLPVNICVVWSDHYSSPFYAVIIIYK